MVDALEAMQIGGELETAGPVSLADMEPSFSEYFTAQAGNTLRDSPFSAMLGLGELNEASREPDRPYTHPLFSGPVDPAQRQTWTPTRKPDVPNAFAYDMAEEAGVKLDLGDGDYTQEAVRIMIDRAQRRARRDEVVAAYDPNMATQFGTALVASLADPINIAAGFLPVVGPARYAALLEGATGFGGRSAVRAGLGAAEGVGGAAAVEPFLAYGATQEGRDYSINDTMANLVFGGVLGGGMHLGAGTFAEKVLGRTYINAPVETPSDIVDRLPVEYKREAMRAAIADVIDGRTVQAADIVDQLIAQDPELANAVTYAATLRRDGPSLDDVPGRVAFWEGKLAGRKASTGKPQDFISWVRSQGGVRDIDGELEGHLGKGHGLPASVYMTSRGAKRSQRGTNFEELYVRAIQEGFVNTRQEFVDAFRSHAGGVVAPVLRRADSENVTRIQEEKDYIKTLLAESGINPNAANKFKARALAGREQHIITAERARISTALQRLESRNDAIARGEEPQPLPKVEEPPKQDTVKPSTEAKELADVGDTVNVTSGGNERVVANEKPVKVERVVDDPVYGKWAFVEGSSTGIRLEDLDLVAKGKPEPTSLPEQVKADQGPSEAIQEVTAQTVRGVIQKMLRESEGGAISSEAVRAKFPQLSNNKFKSLLKEAAAKENEGIGVGKGAGGTTRIFRKTVSAEAKAEIALERYDGGMAQFRRDVDAAYPAMAEKKEYYLSALIPRSTDYDMNSKGIRRWVNARIKSGAVEAIDEDTGKALKQVGSEYFEPDSNMPDVILRFKNEVRKKGEPSQVAKNVKKSAVNQLGPVSPEENAALMKQYGETGAKRALPKRLEEAARESDGTVTLDLMSEDVVLAKVTLLPIEAEKTLFVDIVSAVGKGKNALGAVAMRDLIDLLAERFPGYEKLAYNRMRQTKGGEITNKDTELPLHKRTAKERDADIVESVAEQYSSVSSKTVEPAAPKAEKQALTSPELKEIEAQQKALEDLFLKRLDKLLPLLPPETAANLRASLSRLDADAAEYEAILESATQCLLKP